jgi:hypothetical protein
MAGCHHPLPWTHDLDLVSSFLVQNGLPQMEFGRDADDAGGGGSINVHLANCSASVHDLEPAVVAAVDAVYASDAALYRTLMARYGKARPL